MQKQVMNQKPQQKASTQTKNSSVTNNNTVKKPISTISKQPQKNINQKSVTVNKTFQKNTTLKKNSVSKPKIQTQPKSQNKLTKQNKEVQQQQQQQQQQIQQQQKQTPSYKFEKVIKFKDLLNVYEQTYEEGKIPFIVDNNVRNSHVFFRYKGMLINFEELGLEMDLKVKAEEDVCELVRGQLVSSMKVGHNMVIYNNQLLDYQQFFGNTQWWDQKIIFNQTKLFQEEYYLKRLLKEEENTDIYGQQGNYMPNKDFKLGFIYTPSEKVEEEKQKMDFEEAAYLENIAKKTGLNPDYLCFIKIDEQ